MSTVVAPLNVNTVQQQALEAAGAMSSSGAAGPGDGSSDKQPMQGAHGEQSASSGKKVAAHKAEHNHNRDEVKPKAVDSAAEYRALSEKSSSHSVASAVSGAGAGATAMIEEEEETEQQVASALPAGLRRILSEVARTGESTTLTWESVRKVPSSETSVAGVGGASPAVSKKRGAVGTGCVAPVPLRTRGGVSAPFLSSSGKNKNAPSIGGVPPPRKKRRNGLHSSSHRKPRQNPHRKRPLNLIRGSPTSTTTATVVAPNPSIAMAGAAAGGRFAPSTSGSEQEDASQYDSESTTSTSELSHDQQWQLRHRSPHLNLRKMNTSNLRNTNAARSEGGTTLSYATSLREAFRIAVGLVLDDWFQNKGTYKLSPAESKIHGGRQVSTKDIFLLRKERLLKQLQPSSGSAAGAGANGPPFTIQRIAEVLVAPQKYYTQTHKLCNCLEKLLLVSSPITAFGGSRGGVTSQSRREEQELAALAGERDRIEHEFRQMRRRRSSIASDAVNVEPVLAAAEMVHCAGMANRDVKDPPVALDSRDPASRNGGTTNEGAADAEVAKVTALSPAEAERREQLEAAARASLRSKFDHVGIDPHNHHHHGAVVNVNAKSITDSRSLTNSPPPPGLASAPNLSGLLRSPHTTSHSEHPSSPVRSPSPILFNDVASPTTPPQPALQNSPNPNMHLLHMHHAAAVAGVSPFDLMGLSTSAGSGASSGPTLLGSAQLNGMKELDVESRSSASSDVDSESDDVSFDDSASDRSDGSDSGFAATSAAAVAAPAVAEGSSNFAAVARAMALKRQQTRQAAAAAAATQLQRSQKIPASEPNAGTSAVESAAPSVAAASGGSLVAGAEETGVPEDSDVSDSSLSDMAD